MDATSSSVKPASRSISRVCSPSRGGMRRCPPGCPRSGRRDGPAGSCPRSDDRVLEHADRLQMRLFGDLGELRERGVRHIDPQQQLLPFRRGARGGDVAHAVVDPVDVPRARHRIAHRELLDAFRMSDGFEERAPVVARVGQHGQPAILGAHRPPRLHALVAGRPDRRDEGVAAEHLDAVERGQRLQHRHLDHLALAGALAVQQRRRSPRRSAPCRRSCRRSGWGRRRAPHRCPWRRRNRTPPG